MKHFKRRFDEGYDVPGDTRYIQWLKIHHPECNTPRSNHTSITVTAGCHDTNSISVDKNHPTNSLSSSSKELAVQGNCAENISTQTSLILTKRSKLHPFLKVPTPLAHHSKTKAKGAKVLTSQEYLEDLEEKERLKQEKEEQKEQKRRQREEKAKLKTNVKSQQQKLSSVKAKGNYIYSISYMYSYSYVAIP